MSSYLSQKTRMGDNLENGKIAGIQYRTLNAIRA